MTTMLQLADIDVQVLHKDIKNVHLSVHPPEGRVSVSAPMRMPLDTVRAFLVTKLAWIRDEQRKFRAQERHDRLLYVDRESHWVWGDRMLLSVVEEAAPASVRVSGRALILSVRPGTAASERERILSLWYRDQIRETVSELLPKWEKRIGVNVGAVYVQRMKTKWGSCNPARATIRLNTELAKKPRVCLEYILAHELIHIHEPTHNARFREMMDLRVPNWRDIRDELNRRPLAHDEWANPPGGG